MKTHLPLAAVLAALLNALVWGVSWLPLRWLETHGIANLWVTTAVFSLCALSVLAARPRAFSLLLQTRVLWWVALASGLTNVFFNAALVLGDVVRAVLLFYLMPMWVVFLARFFLAEPITGNAWARIVIAFVGASLVLGQGEMVAPLPQTFADGLAVAGGFMFGLNNVLLRKYGTTHADARALAIFIGGVVLPPIVIAALNTFGKNVPPPMASISTWSVLALFAFAVLTANLALQYGATRLPANTLSVIMISEVLFAAISTVLAGEASLTAWTMFGGALIVCASLLAIFSAQPETNEAHT